MSAGLHEKARELLDEAIKRPPAQRESYLRQRCPESPALVDEVLSLLEYISEAPDDSEQRRSQAFSLRFKHPEKIGDYKLTDLLGSGGFGDVYAAVQQGKFRRSVAIKVIKKGKDSELNLKRFELEGQALASLNHANIAKIYEAATTEEGRPYLAMERVRGTTLTDYCDKHRLGIAERLRLFLKVCDGVRHAHHRGIIHRDLKPSNILVSEERGELSVKIIDFGIAKFVNSDSMVEPVHTRMGEAVGTLLYMAPEQMEGGPEELDITADVYSLGVVLYELIAGATPFDPNQLSFGPTPPAAERPDPIRPSLKLSRSGKSSVKVATARHTNPAALVRRLHGDLDWITLKALEGERTRRYESVGHLADDIVRHMKNEPVLAGSPGAMYRARKFLRRHRVGVGAASLVALALVVGLLSAATGLVRAKVEAEKARQVESFVSSILAGVDPVATQGYDKRLLRKILDDAARRVDSELVDQPDVEASIRLTIGTSYSKLSEFAAAQEHLARSVELFRRRIGTDGAATLRAERELAVVLRERGERLEAERRLESIVDRLARKWGEDHVDTARAKGDLAGTRYQLDDQDATVGELYLEVLRVMRREHGHESERAAAVLKNLGDWHYANGRLQEAREYLEDSKTIRSSLFGPTSLQVTPPLLSLGRVYARLNEWQLAEDVARQALAVRKEHYPDEHRAVAYAYSTLGDVLTKAGEPARAKPVLEEALRRWQAVLGPTAEFVGYAARNLAVVLADLGEHENAFARYRQAAGIISKADEPDPLDIIACLRGCAEALRALGRAEEAREFDRQVAALTPSD